MAKEGESEYCYKTYQWGNELYECVSNEKLSPVEIVVIVVVTTILIILVACLVRQLYKKNTPNNGNNSSDIYDVIVVGGGIIGRFTALQIKETHKEGNILLIDQYTMPQSHGSSKGHSKGIQRANWNKIETCAMKKMKDDSISEWERLNRICSRPIVTKSNALFIGPTESAFMKNTLTSLKKYPDCQQMKFIDTLQQDYPNINFSDNCVGILDTSELCLGADEILKQILETFMKLGGIKRTTKVIKVTPGATISVCTDYFEYRTKQLVVATGPWSSSFLHGLGLDIEFTKKHAMEGYWKLKSCPETICPSVFEYKDKSIFWTNYTTEYGPSLKLGFAGKEISEEDLKNVETMHDKEMVASMTKYVKNKFSKLITDDEPFLVQNCMYTFTKDRKPIIGRHPEWGNIFLAVGMSGTGFGYSPAISNIVCDLVLGNEPKYDISEFSATRSSLKTEKK
ncbi:peroxisomal sarcosine oxidase-like isoform X2 [Mytilus californianus]|uniref:peroxisomal sarcosine oxidase-like isoform X2 n=1 Tax=Mytilus californianus TaxID=6549 RepID=UPI00224806B6|nr:peroxisomal sarcosine oxidase-like isoform X2 [Mytilus californianus]